MNKYTVVYLYSVCIDVEAESASEAKLIAADTSLDVQVTEPFRAYFSNLPVEVYDESLRRIRNVSALSSV